MAFTSFVDSVNKAGGVIPDEYANEIISQLPAQSAAMTMFRRVDMGTKTTVIPVTTALPVAGFVGEGGAFSATTATWTGKQLIAAKVGCIVPIAREVIEDTSYDLQGDLIPKVAEAIGGAIDGAVLFGTGKPAAWTCNDIYAGAIAASAFTTYVASAFAATTISSVMKKVETAGFDVNGFTAHNSVKGLLRDLCDSQGRPIYQAPTAGNPGVLYGENVFYVRSGGWDATKGLVIAGDWTKAILGLRRDISMEILTEASITVGSDTISLAQNDMIGLKFVARVAFQVADCATPEGANKYPFAVLKV